MISSWESPWRFNGALDLVEDVHSKRAMEAISVAVDE